MFLKKVIKNLFDNNFCKKIIDESEEYAEKMDGNEIVTICIKLLIMK